MNKRVNLYLDIYEIIALILALSCMGLCMILQELSFQIPNIISISILIVGIISSLLFISIEVLLFLLMTIKARINYLIFLAIDLLTAIIINRYIPFSAFLVFPIFSMIKNIARIVLVERIYIPKEFNRYCRMFNIKIKDFPKKRKSKTEKESKEIIKSKEIYISKSKKSSKSDKSFA